MKSRALGIAAVLVLIAVLVWTLRHHAASAPAALPSVTASPEPHSDPVSLAPAPAANVARETAAPSAPPETAAPTSTTALVKVLVVNKTSRTPMSGIDVHATYDDGKRSHRIQSTTSSRGKPFESLHSDDQGRVEIESPPDVELRVDATGMKQDAGYDHAIVPPSKAGEVREITLEIQTGDDMPFWMKLVDDTSGTPIAGATIHKGKGGESSLKSDARGLAFLQGRTWSPGLLDVQADGYAKTYLKPEPGHAQSDAALVVKLAKCATVRVHVVDAADHAIANAQIDLTTEGYNLGPAGGASSSDLISMQDPHWRGTTDDAGRATISCVPAHVAIQAGIKSPKPWSAPDKLVFEPGETRDIEWKLYSGCDVHGIVLDTSSAPVTKREMWMRKASRRVPSYFGSSPEQDTRSAVTDEQGRFRFADVGPGSWWLGPSAPKYGANVVADDVPAFAQVVEVAEGQSDLDVTVRVDRGLVIRGQVLDSKGVPTSSGYVSGYELTNKTYVAANFSGRENVFSVGPLMKGRYVLTAHGYGGDADSDPLEVDAGAQDVVLRLKTGASMSGTVVNPAGDPVEAKIWMTMRGSTKFGVHGVSCDNKGAFHIEGLEAGTFDVAASDSDGATGLLDGVVIQTGEAKSGLSIHLAAGGHVRVRHEGPDRFANIAVLSHGVVIDLDGVERSTSKEFAAPAGSVTVQATYHDSEKRVVERTVEVKAGQTVDVVFERDAH